MTSESDEFEPQKMNWNGFKIVNLGNMNWNEMLKKVNLIVEFWFRCDNLINISDIVAIIVFLFQSFVRLYIASFFFIHIQNKKVKHILLLFLLILGIVWIVNWRIVSICNVFWYELFCALIWCPVFGILFYNQWFDWLILWPVVWNSVLSLIHVFWIILYVFVLMVKHEFRWQEINAKWFQNWIYETRIETGW